MSGTSIDDQEHRRERRDHGQADQRRPRVERGQTREADAGDSHHEHDGDQEHRRAARPAAQVGDATGEEPGRIPAAQTANAPRATMNARIQVRPGASAPGPTTARASTMTPASPTIE